MSQEKEQFNISEWGGDKDGEISVCGILKNGTSEIIQKLESETPQLFQVYTDLYMRYLHSIQECYGVCHISEKRYFDKIKIDNRLLKQMNDYYKSCTKITDAQIDLTTSFLRSYVQFKISLIDSWDKYTHVGIDTYAKFLSTFVENKK